MAGAVQPEERLRQQGAGRRYPVLRWCPSPLPSGRQAPRPQERPAHRPAKLLKCSPIVTCEPCLDPLHSWHNRKIVHYYYCNQACC